MLIAGAAVPATAAGLPRPLVDGGAAEVVGVIDGDTVVLGDGREVRLVGIQAPKLPLDRPNFVAWPLADRAKALLESLALHRKVRLGYGGARLDRYGRVLAHLFADDTLWLQGALLAKGMARVYSFADNRALVAELLAEERAARAGRRGIWSDPYYAVLDAADAERQIGRFVLVEGRVTSAAVVNGRGYLNFGPDHRTDFTASIAPADRRAFERGGRDVPSFEGLRVRVRGWLERLNGPMIAVTHAEQIELLEE